MNMKKADNGKRRYLNPRTKRNEAKLDFLKTPPSASKDKFQLTPSDEIAIAIKKSPRFNEHTKPEVNRKIPEQRRTIQRPDSVRNYTIKYLYLGFSFFSFSYIRIH